MIKNIIPAQPGWWAVSYDKEFKDANPVIAWEQSDKGLIPVTWDHMTMTANTNQYLDDDFGAVIYYPKNDFNVEVQDEICPDYQLTNVPL